MSERKIPDLGLKGLQKSEALPTIEPNDPYMLAWNVKCWTVIEGRLVPRLRTIPLTMGCNNIDKSRDLASMTGMMLSRGWNIIPQELGPDGSYLVEIEVARGTAYIGAWEFENPGSAITDIDLEGYAEWLEELVSEEVIKPCPRYIIQNLIADYNRQIAQLVTEENSGNKRSVPLREQLVKDLKMLESKIENMPKRLATRKKSSRRKPAKLS